MVACAMLPSVTDNTDIDSDPAHRLPMEMAGDQILDCVSTADLMQKAIYNKQPEAEVLALMATARKQFETYLELMAEAAGRVAPFKP